MVFWWGDSSRRIHKFGTRRTVVPSKMRRAGKPTRPDHSSQIILFILWSFSLIDFQVRVSHTLASEIQRTLNGHVRHPVRDDSEAPRGTRRLFLGCVTRRVSMGYEKRFQIAATCQSAASLMLSISKSGKILERHNSILR